MNIRSKEKNNEKDPRGSHGNIPLSISFVMPMFNERASIGNTVKEIKSLAGELTHDFEIIIVDDASTDGSGDIVDGMAQRDDTIRSFRLKSNTKFGGAFAECFRQASKDVIVYLDSDMPVSSEDVRESFPLIFEADIVTGFSRVKKGDTVKRKFISGVYNLMVQSLFRLNIKDINSGYKIVRRELVKDLNFRSLSPFIDVELFLHARDRNATVVQYPLVFCQRQGGRSHITGVPIILATFRDMIKLKFTAG